MKNLLKIGAPFLLVLVLGLAAIAYFGTGSHQQLVTLVFIWAIFALGWNVIGGYGGQLSAGHAMFFGVGAFVPTLMFRWWDITPALGIFAGMAVAVVAGLIIGWPTFRLAGVYFTLATLVYPLIFIPTFDWLGLQEVSLPFKRENAAWYFQFTNPQSMSLLALFVLLLAVCVAIRVDTSKLGLMLRAVKDNQPAAEAAGIDTFRTKMTGMAISAAISSAAGTLMATGVLFVVTPDSVFGLLVSVQALLLAFVGGAGTVFGPLIGAALIIPLADFLIARYGATLPGLNGILLGTVLIIVILFAPGGLYGRVRDYFLARREREEVARAAGTLDATGEKADGGPVPTEVVFADRPPVRPQSERVVLRTENLTRKYGGLRAVDSVSIEVHDQELLGIIGPNGAGKTTLFDVINGLVPASEGKIFFGDQETTSLKPHQICRLGVGRTFQVVRMFKDMPLIENVKVGALFAESSSAESNEAAMAALRRVGLEHQASRPVSGLNTADLRRMEFARALVSQPSILLADECLAGLGGDDVRMVVELLRSIRESGVTVVVIEHTMSAMVQLVDRFVVLDHGQVIADGHPQDIVKDERVIEAYLGRKWVTSGHADG